MDEWQPPALDNDVDFQTDELRRNVGQSFVFPLGRAPFADEILAFDITELTHPLLESGIYAGKSFARYYDRNPNAPHLSRLLRARRERPRDRRAAQERDELAASQV